MSGYENIPFVCPFCGLQSCKLDSAGIDNATNRDYKIIGAGLRYAKCPICKSIDRTRLVYTYLKYEKNIFAHPQTRVIHIAPEMVLADKFFEANFTNYSCGDFYAEGQHANYPNFVKQMDIQNLPFKDGSFNVVICNHVLEHVQDDRKSMQEIFRVLCKGGWSILQVPISPILEKTIENPSITDGQMLEKLFGQKDHVRLYGMDYVSRLESCGFNVECIKLANKYPNYGLNPLETLFIAHKD